MLIEARRPEASLPAGLDMPRLGEIGLRLLGTDAGEAYRIAQSIDWRTTLLVPVPTDATAFRKVDIRGASGLLIESARRDRGGTAALQTILMWSSGDLVLALIGSLPADQLLEMAQSTQ
jgi:hypothetical protein